jgi:hypothetical protein
VIHHRDILVWLIDRGLDINDPEDESIQGVEESYRNKTIAVLNAAAKSGDVDLFDYLVSRGAIPSRSNALHNASQSNNAAAMITHLVDTYHMDVNASDSCGGLNEVVKWKTTPVTPLNYAITYSNLPAVETLLKYGATGATSACSIAISKNNIPAVKILLEAGADPSKSLGVAVTKDRLEIATICLERGGDIAVAEERDRFVAAISGRYHGMSSEMKNLLDQWK